MDSLNTIDKYSVLITVYQNDNPSHFEESIKSLWTQEVTPDEIILIQDGPLKPDLERKIADIKKQSPCRLIHKILKKNIGLSKALNYGLAFCSNNLIMRQDSDDISLPNRSSLQLEVFKQDSSIDLLSSSYDQYDFSMEAKVSDRKLPLDFASIKKFSRSRTPINHACLMFKKDIIMEIGGYPLIDGFAEDWWLSLRAIKNNKKIINLPDSLVKVRGGKDFFQRRSGIRYMLSEIKNQLAMLREGLISTTDAITNILIRTPIRMFPKEFLEFVYKNIIRKKQ